MLRMLEAVHMIGQACERGQGKWVLDARFFPPGYAVTTEGEERPRGHELRLGNAV